MPAIDPLQGQLHYVGRLLRQTVPADFSRSGVYLMPDDACPATATPDGIAAWTNPALDVQLRSYLESRGLWGGRGFAAVFKRSWAASYGNCLYHLLATALHELGHWLTYPKPITFGVGREEREICQRQANAMAAYLSSCDRPPLDSPPTAPKWHGHNAQFIRACIHLSSANRQRADLKIIHTRDLQVAGKTYGLSDVDEYEDALAGESLPAWRRPLRDLLVTPPPRKFLELWERDTKQVFEPETSVAATPPAAAKTADDRTFFIFRQGKRGAIVKETYAGKLSNWNAGFKSGYRLIKSERVKIGKDSWRTESGRRRP